MCIPSTTRCTSLSSLLFILIFIKSHILFFAHPICFAHLTVLLFCTFLYSIAHLLLISFFYLYIYIYSCVVLLLYNLILTLFFIFLYIYFLFFNSLHCPLSGPDLNYISLLIIPCIIYHVTNKETLTLTYTTDIDLLQIRLSHTSLSHDTILQSYIALFACFRLFSFWYFCVFTFLAICSCINLN